MKKGLYQFLNSFSAKLLGLLFGVALFTFFIGLSPVNAGTTINTGGTIKSGNQTNSFNLVWTGECQNPFVFLTIQHYRTRTVSSMTYDGQAMTLLSTGNASGNSFVDVYYYIPTTATGTKQISYTQSASDWSGTVAVGLCNVNPEDPIEDYYINTGTASGNQSNSDVDVNYNGSFMLSWLSYYGGVTYNANLSDINLPWTIQEQIVSGPSPDATWIRNYIGGGTINSGQNQTVAWTSSANWIGWGYVVLTPYTQSNSGAYLSLQPSYKFPTRFSGQVNFTYDPTIFYNSQDYIKIETCAGTGNDIPDCNDLTLIGTSTIMTPLDISLQNPSGNGRFTVSSETPITKTYKITPYLYNSPEIFFEPLYTRIEIIENIEDQLAGLQDYFNPENIASSTGGLDIYSLACSAEDWADTNWWTQIRCKTTYSILQIMNGFVNWGTNAINFFIGQIVSLFPFNLAEQMRIAWVNSGDSSLPNDLTWLNIADSNGNIYVDFPKEWTFSASSTPMLVFGPGIFAYNSTMENFFDNIRSLSTYFIWSLFIWNILKKGKKVFNEITPNKENE